ncbi:SNARE-like superfamily protein [Actinidia rufa]|uniref:SNARE-like superfamily protein n=1 Tax=Actinidia rufa TaxID=165716 RepID=A0A7J0FLQ9_9ERIC|nr:SNARE-like superfamily protein [Actinidia rufa]
MVLDEYQKNFGDSWRTVQADSTQPWPYLSEALTKFQDPAEADKLLKIQRELDETKIILQTGLFSISFVFAICCLGVVRVSITANSPVSFPIESLTLLVCRGEFDFVWGVNQLGSCESENMTPVTASFQNGIAIPSFPKHKTIDSVLARGEKLDSLVEKSSDLSAASQDKRHGCGYVHIFCAIVLVLDTKNTHEASWREAQKPVEPQARGASQSRFDIHRGKSVDFRYFSFEVVAGCASRPGNLSSITVPEFGPSLLGALDTSKKFCFFRRSSLSSIIVLKRETSQQAMTTDELEPQLSSSLMLASVESPPTKPNDMDDNPVPQLHYEVEQVSQLLSPDPKLLNVHKVSQKADVYSFGVLLLELLTGNAPNQAVDLPKWVRLAVREKTLFVMFDQKLLEFNDIEEEMFQILQPAICCAFQYSNYRPQ